MAISQQAKDIYGNLIAMGNAIPLANTDNPTASTVTNTSNFSTAQPAATNFGTQSVAPTTTSASPVATTAQDSTVKPTASGTTASPWADTSTASTYQASTLPDPAKWNITPDQTVSGQLDSVMKKDSPLMQQARTTGLQQANDRGLLNSSMAIGAAQDSVIRNALPIATSDANANLGANRLNTETANQFSVNNAQYENASSSFNAQQKNNTDQYNISNQYNQAHANFDSNVQASLKQLDQQYSWDSDTRKMATDIMNNAQTQKQAILTTLGKNYNSATKQKLMDQIDANMVSTMKLMGLSSSVADVSSLLDFSPTQITPSTNLKDQQLAAKNLASFSKVANANGKVTQAAIDAGYAKRANNSPASPYVWDTEKIGAAQRASSGTQPTQADITAGYANSKGEWLI
jgi:hypothetical protein